MKISVSIISWCEEDAIPLALRSIKGFADEVVVLDNGSFDDTVRVARETMDTLNLPGEVTVKSGLLMYESRYQAIQMCTGEWVMMQDANLVMRNKGPHGTEALRRLAETNRERKIIFRAGDINLYGDYLHVFKRRPVNVPHKLFFHNVGEILEATPPTRDRPSFPALKKVTLKGVWGANLSTVRPAWRVWYRMRQSDWILDGRYGSIPEYVEHEMGKTLSDVKRISPQWYLNACRNQCVKVVDHFDEGLDILPEVLREELRDPRFRVVYRDGEIVGRLPDVPPGGMA